MWDSENKQKVIDEFVRKDDGDLEKSYAYGDTNGDFSMLSIVGNPIAINPNRELFFNIKNDPELSKRTAIIIERKDLVFKIDTNVEMIKGLYD